MNGVWQIPLTQPFEAIPFYLPPQQLHAPTSDLQVPAWGWGNIGLFFCLSFPESPLNFSLVLSTYSCASRGSHTRSDLTCVALLNELINMCLATLTSSLAIPDAFSLSYRVMNVFYVVKSKGIYCTATSTGPSQNLEQVLQGLEKSYLFPKHLCHQFPREIYCTETFFLQALSLTQS